MGLTAPYMHNGLYTNLEEVIGFYNNGGGVGGRINIINQTLSKNSIKLSKKRDTGYKIIYAKLNRYYKFNL